MSTINIRRILTNTLAIYSFAVGCGSDNSSNTKEAWNEANNPAVMSVGDQSYVMDFASLPLKGKLSKHPWTADYWPTNSGGISQRWNANGGDPEEYIPLEVRAGYPILTRDQVMAMTLEQKKALSPAEKYDIFIGRYDFPFTQKERRRTRVMRTIPGNPEYDENFEIPGWEGLCHGWAPGALNFDEPHSAVLVNNDNIEVPFGSADVKGLLTFLEHSVSSRTNFLAGRCNLDFSGYRYREPVEHEFQATMDSLRSQLNNGTITRADFEAKAARARKDYDDQVAQIEKWVEEQKNSPECRDTNAGSFHVVITNQIALRNEGFVADVTRDYQVWNQPVSEYSSEIVAEFKDIPTISRELGENYLNQAAPGTSRVVQIKTLMTYTVEVQSSYEPQDYSGGEDESTTEYNYYLELDSQGRIIGGKWLDNVFANTDRPDFLWKKTAPTFSGQFAPLAKIYQAAIAPHP